MGAITNNESTDCNVHDSWLTMILEKKYTHMCRAINNSRITALEQAAAKATGVGGDLN